MRFLEMRATIPFLLGFLAIILTCFAICTGTKAVIAIAMAAAAFIVLASFGAFIGYQRVSKRREGKIPNRKEYPL